MYANQSVLPSTVRGLCLIDNRSFRSLEVLEVGKECYGFDFKISSAVFRNCDWRKVCGIELPGDCNRLNVGTRRFPAWVNDKCSRGTFFCQLAAFGPVIFWSLKAGIPCDTLGSKYVYLFFYFLHCKHSTNWYIFQARFGIFITVSLLFIKVSKILGGRK